MNVLPSLAQEGFRQAELMTSAPLCPASKEQGMVLMSSLWRVLPLHIYISVILMALFHDRPFFETLLGKFSKV